MISMNKRTVFVLLAALFAANLLVWVPNSLARNTVFNQLNLLVDVRSELVDSYVEPVDESQLVQSAVRGMVESLEDPYTVYLSPEELKGFDSQVRGSFSGIGAEITIDEQTRRLKIVTPLEDSPAWKAGVMAGDIVLEINGESTVDIKINEAVEKLTGPEGTQVTVKVRHESGEEATFTITRARINIQTVRGLRRDKDNHWQYVIDPKAGVGYVRLTQFTERTAEELHDALEQMNKAGAKGVILDLRFNPGGLLESAVEISDMFLQEGQTIVSVKGRRVPEQVEKATSNGQIFKGAVVVLANEASASASEIVTGALLDNQRAMFVGTRTYGKGSVQQVRLLEDEQGAIKMTNAYYYLPSGRNIHRRPNKEVWGVDPPDGFIVPMTSEQVVEMIKVRRDSDVLRRDAANPPEITGDWIEAELKDLQLAAALRTIQAKITAGDWLKVGKSGAQDMALESRRNTLERQREMLQERIEEIDQELDKLAKGEFSVRDAHTKNASVQTTSEQELLKKSAPAKQPEPATAP
jgi:carboxyl-terminal processing protease